MEPRGKEEPGAKQHGAGGKVQETLLGEWSVLREGAGGRGCRCIGSGTGRV